MKVFIFCFSLFSFLSTFAQKKLALLVAIGNYLPDSDIPPIASLNDVKYIKAVLKNNGFAEKDIDTLQNAKATKAAILKSLDALAKKAQKGDVVLIHFACHGQQIRDQKTVELGKDEEDGFDEALLPYDVKKAQYYPGIYTGENHLRDEELGEKFIAIRNSLGSKGNLLVLIDACHSGTATRAAEFASSRGEPVPFYDPANPIAATVNLSADDHFFDNLSDSASNMVMISGSGPHQQNFQAEVLINGEKEEVGSLSYAFYKAMSELPKDSDYDLLFQKIKAFIQSLHPSQIPMIEGNSSQLVFSGNYNPKKEIISLTAIVDDRSQTDTVFKITQGVMDGISEGSIIDIYVAGTTAILCTGVIKRCDRFAAYGISSKLLNKGVAYEAKINSVNNGLFAAFLKIKTDKNDASTSALKKQVKASIATYKFISISDNADMMLDICRLNEKNISINLIDGVDSTRWKKIVAKDDSLTMEDTKGIIGAIKNTVRIKYLRSMPDGGELTKYVSVQIVPLKAFAAKEEIVLNGEDLYSIKFVNKSGEKLFYTVIDLTPDNKIEIIYPSEIKLAADYSIDKNSTVTRNLRVSKTTPVGREFLKIIVSKEPMNLRDVLFSHTAKRSEMKSFQSALDDLFNTTNEAATRGDISNIKAEEVGIFTVSFTVNKKN